MFTLEIKDYADFNKEDVFRITITNDAMETLTHEDFAAYKNVHSLILENNTNLTTLDLRGNTSIKYLCLGTCDNLKAINLEGSNVHNIDLYDLVSLESVELDTRQLLNLKEILSENITKQFLYIEDAILESFEQRIVAAKDDVEKNMLLKAYENYLESE